MKTDHMESNDHISRTLTPGKRSGSGRLLRNLIFGALVIVAAGILVKWNMGDTDPGVRFITQPAKTGDLTVTVTATGNLEPTNQVDVGSELSGIVRVVEVDYNDPVTKGQVLARLDTTKLEAQVLQSRAALEGARAKVLQVQATIGEAQTKLDRLRHLENLTDRRAVSKLDLDVAEATLLRAKADEASAKAEVDRANALLYANETDLSKALIRSPINGIVLVRSVEPGQTVAASLQAPVLFTLAEDLTKMELRVDVDEADVGKVKADQKAVFTVDAYPERSFPARITKVRFGSKTVEGVVTYETILNVDNADLSLRPGMTATAEIVVEEIHNALLVPNAALRFTPPENSKETPRQGGGILTKLFPRPRSSGPPAKTRHEMSSGGKPQRVWSLRDGKPFPVSVSIGMTDGNHTQITGGEIRPDIQLVVDTASTVK
jgi:HlyD family secretion protein